MKNIKRLIAMIIAGVLCISMLFLISSCGESGDGNGGENNGGDNGSSEGNGGDNSGSETPGSTTCNHYDLDKDGKCDACNADFVLDTGEVDFTLTLKDESGNPLPNVSFSLSGNDSYTGKTDATGSFTIKAYPGSYYIMVTDGLPEMWTIGGSASISISKENPSVELVAINNTPDGSAEKPFFLGSEELVQTIPAGATFNYFFKGVDRVLSVYNSDLVVVHEGQEYTATAGVIELEMAGTDDFYSNTKLTITNPTGADIEGVRIYLGSKPGTQENPFVIEDLTSSITAEVVAGKGVCYEWTASENGSLTYSVETQHGKIIMQNLTTSATTDESGENKTLSVVAGQTIRITVSMVEETKDESGEQTGVEELSGSVTFSLTFVAAN